MLVTTITIAIVLLFAWIAQQFYHDFNIFIQRYNDIMNSNYSQHLLGEINISTPSKSNTTVDPIQLASSFIREFQTTLQSPSHTWINETIPPKMISTSGDEKISTELQVISKRLSGDYEKSGIPIERARWVVDCSGDYWTAKSLFEFLVSPEGFSVIDPITDPKEHGREPVIEFKPETNGDDKNMTYKVQYVSIPMIFQTVELLVYNIVDYDHQIFVSKSVASDLVPGISQCGSSSGIGNDEDNCHQQKNTSMASSFLYYLKNFRKTKRATNTFGLKISEIQINTAANSDINTDFTKTMCLVESVNYICGMFPNTHFQYIANSVIFYTGLVQRLVDRMDAITKDIKQQ